MMPAHLARSGSTNQSLSLIFFIMVCMCVPAGTTGAQSIEEARTLYTEGRFAEAADLAPSLDTSEGYALAANSLVIYSYHMAPDGEKESLLRRAIELARKAIRLDNSNPEAHLQLAHATGRLAQVTGTWEALNEGYAGQVREAIEEALRLAPNMAAAHLSLATWHAGVVVAGFMAGVLYDASEEDALAHFERSLELAPHEKIVLLEYALGLLALDADDNRAKARDLLERAITFPAKDAYDRILHQKAVEQLAALDGG